MPTAVHSELSTELLYGELTPNFRTGWIQSARIPCIIGNFRCHFLGIDFSLRSS